MADVHKGTRYIAVASPSTFTNNEWKAQNPTWTPPPPTHQDYALMKVLSMLRIKTKKNRYPVHPFQWEQTVVPLDFSNLEDSDIIFIVGHGDHNGLYALGPNAKEGTRRLVKLLTGDGNLKAKRSEKEIIILLLSCRAGLGLYKAVARSLFLELGRDLNVGGAIGFTFGSTRTSYLALNEVLIKGIPWFIEYPTSITKSDAEKETSKREGKTIKYADKETEIEAFKDKKKDIEKDLKEIVGKLKSTEVNAALDELEKDFRAQWFGLVQSQFFLYATAKTKSNLEFDMWHDLIVDGYVWTTGKKPTAAAVSSILTGDLSLLDGGATSVK